MGKGMETTVGLTWSNTLGTQYPICVDENKNLAAHGIW